MSSSRGPSSSVPYHPDYRHNPTGASRDMSGSPQVTGPSPVRPRRAPSPRHYTSRLHAAARRSASQCAITRRARRQSAHYKQQFAASGADGSPVARTPKSPGIGPHVGFSQSVPARPSPPCTNLSCPCLPASAQNLPVSGQFCPESVHILPILLITPTQVYSRRSVLPSQPQTR